MNQLLPRLLYLANELRSPLPRGIAKLVPQGDLLMTMSTIGVVGTTQSLALEPEQLTSLIDAGSTKGKATLEEWRQLIAFIGVEKLIEERDDLELREFIRRNETINAFLNGSASIIPVLRTNWNDPDASDVIKWDSGLDFLDAVVEGFYHGLFVYMGGPGTGKTSLLLSTAESLRANGFADEIWFFETEIPRDMFQYRLRPLKKRSYPFVDGKDQIFYGQSSMTEILELIHAYPNPNRVIIYDSPDVLASGADDNRRFELERIFRDLVVIKNVSKAVFVASQMSRKDKDPKLTSVSESWSKAWYADAIIGYRQMGVRGTSALMKAAVLKNRFGPSGFEVTFKYDLVDLTGSLDGGKKKAIGWEDTNEGDW